MFQTKISVTGVKWSDLNASGQESLATLALIHFWTVPQGIPGSGSGSIYGSRTVFSKFYGSSVLNGLIYILKYPNVICLSTRSQFTSRYIILASNGVISKVEPLSTLFWDFSAKYQLILIKYGLFWSWRFRGPNFTIGPRFRLTVPGITGPQGRPRSPAKLLEPGTR